MKTVRHTHDSTDKDLKDRPKRPWLLAVKFVGWAIMAVALFILGILLGVITILTPDRLTPLAERIATQSLQNAKVEIERVDLTIVSSFPFVHADIDNLVVLSTITEKLDAETRATLPEYTDTVLSVHRFSGGLNVMRLFADKLDLADVTIDHPSVNIVIIDEETNNFDIIPPSEDKDDQPFNWQEVPGISLKRFEIVNPGKIRFFNNDTQTELSAAFTQVELDGSDAPLYALKFDGNIEAPSELYEVFNIPSLRFGLNGSMSWSQERPELLRLENFDFLFSIFGGRINTDIDFSGGVTLRKLDIKMLPLNIMQLLRMVPEDMAIELGIPLPGQVNTTASVNLDFALKKPWNIGSDTIAPFVLNADIPRCEFSGYDFKTNALEASLKVSLNRPWAISDDLPDLTVNVNVAPMALKWNDLDLRKFALQISGRIPDGDINKASINVKNLELSGPATDLTIAGTLTNIIEDPLFDGNIEGRMDLRKLPAKVRNSFDGSISGVISTSIAMKGSPSMFSTENFHRIRLKGDLSLSNLYWVSGDTMNMVDLHKADFHFGTTEKFIRDGNTRADSLMRIRLAVDTGLIVNGDLVMRMSKFNIGLAAQNTSERLNKGRVNPMGGNLSLKSFDLLKTNDSAVVRLRNVDGYTVVKAYNNDIRTPQFIFDLNAGRISTGDKETRLLISNAHTHINVRRVPKGKSAQRFSKIADSVHYAHPNISPDSVMKIALEIHNRHRSKYPRVHERWNAADTADVIDWGASPLFKRLLTLWTFEGTLTSNRASLFTPHLPLRNRLKHIDISFNNDSVKVNNLLYKIGHSDFTINGVMSNMRRAFTQAGYRQPLRINFEVLSDTIDINQITETLLAGAAYGATPVEKRRFDLSEIDADEESMEEHIARLTEDAPDTVMPILIPENLDAQFSMRSRNVEYSDFELQNMTGRILAYGGALNLQNLSASSEVGSIDISALYSGLHPDNLRFGFDLRLNQFNLHRFLNLVPAVDSLLPVMRDFSGIISANIAATSDVDREMNLVLPSLDAAIGIEGDSLVLLDPDTFKSLSKWLLFKDKNKNIIDHMNVQMVVKDNQVDVYPFIFDFDRYRLGIQGYNDFDMNFNYHIAVLKSPIPFKFGINISGNLDKYKIRLGGAKFGEKQIRQVAIVDTTRINLMNEINNVFKRGARNARLARLKVETSSPAANIDLDADTLTHADSLRYIQEGLIDAPVPQPKSKNRRSKSNTKHEVKSSDADVVESGIGVLVVFLSMALLRFRKRIMGIRNKNNDN